MKRGSEGGSEGLGPATAVRTDLRGAAWHTPLTRRCARRLPPPKN